MPDDIPFDKNLDLAPDTVDEPMPGVRRVMADNPGPFTFKGTVSYIVGRGTVAIVDPGPADERHIGALLDAVRNETVTAILVTHTHRDHSPAVPAIKAATGATVYAEGPHRAARPLHIGEHNPLDSSGDRDFRPDVALKDGEIVRGAVRAFGIDGGAGRRLDRRHGRRVVAVGVGDEDRRHRLVAHGIEQRADVALIGRPGVDDGDLAAADDVAERALEGERPRIISHHAADARHRLVHRVGGEIEIFVEGDVVGHDSRAHGGCGGRRQWVFAERLRLLTKKSV